jgi:hypothetical protein
LVGAHLDGDSLPARRILVGVVEQIRQYFHHPVAVGKDQGQARFGGKLEGAVDGAGADLLHDLLHDRQNRKWFRLKRQLPRLNAGRVQHIAHQTVQSLDLLAQDRQHPDTDSVLDVAIGLDVFHRAVHVGERRAELMRHQRDKFRPHVVEFLQIGVGPGELFHLLGQFARALGHLLTQAGVEAANLLLAMLALGNVAQDDGHAQALPGLVGEGRDRHIHGHRAAGHISAGRLVPPDVAGLPGALDQPAKFDLGGLAAAQQAGERPTQNLARREAKDEFRPTVPGFDLSFRVEAENGIGGDGGDGGQPLCTGVGFFLGAFFLIQPMAEACQHPKGQPLRPT